MMFKLFKFLIFGLAFISLECNKVIAFEAPRTTDNIHTVVNEALEKFNVPGAAIGLVVDNEVIFTQGYGFRDLKKALPVTENTLFPIGSCTKAFTAFILGQLVDQRKVSLDDCVIKYIPEFRLLDPNVTCSLTIRDLLAHRTGMARHDPLWFFKDISRSDVLELLQHLDLACELRQEFQYNNLMYSVAGIVIEKVTGQSWEEAISSRIFFPLGMKSSNTTLEELLMSHDFSLPHAEIEGIRKTISFRSIAPVNPGGGINSNIFDMVKWIQLHLFDKIFLKKDVIQKQTLQEMHTVQMPLSSFPKDNEGVSLSGYGLGWFVGNYRGYDWITHGGDIDGFSSEVSLLPQKKIGLVILTNSSSDGRHLISCLRNYIFDHILGTQDIDWMKKTQEIRDKEKRMLQGLNEKNPIARSSHALQDYVGYYEHPAYGEVQINIKNNSLIVSFGKEILLLNPKSDDAFKGKFPDLLIFGIYPFVDFTFFRKPSGEISKLEIPFEGFRSLKPIVFIPKQKKC